MGSWWWRLGLMMVVWLAYASAPNAEPMDGWQDEQKASALTAASATDLPQAPPELAPAVEPTQAQAEAVAARDVGSSQPETAVVASPAQSTSPAGFLSVSGVRVFGGLAMSVTQPFQSGSKAPGGGAGVQVDLGNWCGAWMMASAQSPDSVVHSSWDYGQSSLEFEVWSAALLAGPVARLNVAALSKPATDWVGRILTSIEFGFGPIVGLGLYRQTLRAEATRTAWVPLAGVHMEFDVWFASWVGLRFAGDFAWSLNHPIGGQEGLLRSEIFLGPSFRFQ